MQAIDGKGTTSDDRAAITRSLEEYGVNSSAEKAVQLDRYMGLVQARRDWAGLSSRSLGRNPASAVLESLCVLAVVRSDEEIAVADLGSGGGLLGMVLAIACERWKVTLVESSSRKSAALAEMAGALHLENTAIYNGRAQGLVGESRFDIVVSRAAGSLGKVAPVALGLLAPGGRYVALKGAGVERELEEAEPVLMGIGAEIVEVTVSPIAGEEGVSRKVSLVVTGGI